MMTNPPFPISDAIWRVRLKKLEKLYFGKVLVEAFKWNNSLKEYVVTKGLIEEEPRGFSGVWGYGGDIVAVKINGDFWPSSCVREAIKELCEDMVG